MKPQVELTLQLARDRDAALELVALMHKLSEQYWISGWQIGLPFDLWGYVLGQQLAFGDDPDPDAVALWEHELAQLARLALRAGGWWWWNEDLASETFVTLPIWTKLFDINRPSVSRGSAA